AGARSHASRWGSFVAGASFGEDAGGFDHDRPAAEVHAHQHDAQIAGFERASLKTGGGFGFEHAAGGGGAAVDERLAVDHDRLIDGGAEGVSGMRRRARKRVLQTNRDGGSLGQFRGGGNQRLARRNASRAGLAIEGEFL